MLRQANQSVLVVVVISSPYYTLHLLLSYSSPYYFCVAVLCSCYFRICSTVQNFKCFHFISTQQQQPYFFTDHMHYTAVDTKNSYATL